MTDNESSNIRESLEEAVVRRLQELFSEDSESKNIIENIREKILAESSSLAENIVKTELINNEEKQS
jgi:hypothetical protein